MGSFGEDLRMERISRGIALEEITAVTKISQHHLVALEQERFRLLPGGILSKGIVRGYTGALGLDQHDWTERFLKAYGASGQMIDDDRSWTAFAANVGKARILRHDAVENRLRWAGAILLLLVVAAAAFLMVRYYRRPRRLVDHPVAHGPRLPPCPQPARSTPSAVSLAFDSWSRPLDPSPSQSARTPLLEIPSHPRIPHSL